MGNGPSLSIDVLSEHSDGELCHDFNIIGMALARSRDVGLGLDEGVCMKFGFCRLRNNRGVWVASDREWSRLRFVASRRMCKDGEAGICSQECIKLGNISKPFDPVGRNLPLDNAEFEVCLRLVPVKSVNGSFAISD